MEMCRNWAGSYAVDVYNLMSCAMCYTYLFHNQSELKPVALNDTRLYAVNGSVYKELTIFYPDIRNKTIVDAICLTLNNHDCYRWTLCCENAIRCCDRQRATPNYTKPGNFCPRTWDGYGCFDDTPANQSTVIKCPNYIEQANPFADAVKECTETGTWYVNPGSKKEWTNYTGCVEINDFKILFKVGLVCNIISIVLLIPACVVFLYYRQLRLQQRIKLHMCLFVSFIITSVVMILWDVLVFNDRLENSAKDAIMFQDPPACKVLYILTRYAFSTTYVWMFLEGFHLHRLIVKAFKVPKSLILYHLIGWGLPVIPMIIYTAVRIHRQDKSCWVYHAGIYEWIVYIPNLLCIAFNVFFLCNILRILMTQLQSHPNEPSNYRRALKATFILVPLFGVQLFLIIYRPPASYKGYFVYEVIAKIVKNSQGAIVALIFCFLNGEVHSHIKNSLPNQLRRKPQRSEFGRTNSCTTQYTMESTRAPSMRAKVADDKHTYIPLNTLVDESRNSNGQNSIRTPIVRNKR